MERCVENVENTRESARGLSSDYERRASVWMAGAGTAFPTSCGPTDSVSRPIGEGTALSSSQHPIQIHKRVPVFEQLFARKRAENRVSEHDMEERPKDSCNPLQNLSDRALKYACKIGGFEYNSRPVGRECLEEIISLLEEAEGLHSAIQIERDILSQFPPELCAKWPTNNMGSFDKEEE